VPSGSITTQPTWPGTIGLSDPTACKSSPQLAKKMPEPPSNPPPSTSSASWSRQVSPDRLVLAALAALLLGRDQPRAPLAVQILIHQSGELRPFDLLTFFPRCSVRARPSICSSSVFLHS
jgi:hypothetical protein